MEGGQRSVALRGVGGRSFGPVGVEDVTQLSRGSAVPKFGGRTQSRADHSFIRTNQVGVQWRELGFGSSSYEKGVHRGGDVNAYSWEPRFVRKDGLKTPAQKGKGGLLRDFGRLKKPKKFPCCITRVFCPHPRSHASSSGSD